MFQLSLLIVALTMYLSCQRTRVLYGFSFSLCTVCVCVSFTAGSSTNVCSPSRTRTAKKLVDNMQSPKQSPPRMVEVPVHGAETKRRRKLYKTEISTPYECSPYEVWFCKFILKYTIDHSYWKYWLWVGSRADMLRILALLAWLLKLIDTC